MGLQEDRADGVFDEAAAPDGVGIGFFEGAWDAGCDEGVVLDEEFGAAGATANFGAGVGGQAGDEEGLVEELEVVGEGCCVAGVDELAEHFIVGEDLGGMVGSEAEEVAKEGGFGDGFELEDVAGEGGFDEGVVDVAKPEVGVADVGCGPGVAAVQEPGVEIPTKGLAHFGPVPMGATVEKESAGEAFGEPFLKEEGRGAEEEGAEFAGGVGVPEAFDFFAPATDLLNFVEDEPDGAGGSGGEMEGGGPLGLDPLGSGASALA
jgi:hypothetical protein